MVLTQQGQLFETSLHVLLRRIYPFIRRLAATETAVTVCKHEVHTAICVKFRVSQMDAACIIVIIHVITVQNFER